MRGSQSVISKERERESEDLLVDGGLKLAELGSWSPSEALGSDVAISPLVSDLQLGNNSAANKSGQLGDTACRSAYANHTDTSNNLYILYVY